MEKPIRRFTPIGGNPNGGVKRIKVNNKAIEITECNPPTKPYKKDERSQLRDYKFTCTNGIAHNVMLCYDRGTGDTKFYFFDKDWKLLRLNKRGKQAPKDFSIERPSNLDKMFEIAGKLSEGLPYARVDLYNVNGHIYFGEITFYPQSGFDPNLLPETELAFGNLIKLDKQ